MAVHFPPCNGIQVRSRFQRRLSTRSQCPPGPLSLTGHLSSGDPQALRPCLLQPVSFTFLPCRILHRGWDGGPRMPWEPVEELTADGDWRLVASQSSQFLTKPLDLWVLISRVDTWSSGSDQLSFLKLAGVRRDLQWGSTLLLVILPGSAALGAEVFLQKGPGFLPATWLIWHLLNVP